MPLPTGVADAVVRWQRLHGRQSLPWQHTRDPYRVWLSEIMLQQTQVGTVLGYYERFLARFPDVVSLADASLDEVLALWSGLGYYSRARHLHRCARTVRDEHAGDFPRTAEALAQLPGIGRSTAAAIAAFCYGERAAILDGNVRRVLARVLAYGEDLARVPAQRQLWQHAQDLLPTRADDMPAYTQGLMDLGATVCRLRTPTCATCPLTVLCRARAQATPEAYPVRTRTLRRTRRQHCWLWLDDGESVWLEQRPAQGVWAGLWTLPLFDDATALSEAVMALGVEHAPVALPVLHHALTHFDWELQPWHLRVPTGWPIDRPGRWIPRAQLADTALPAPLRKLLGAG